MSVALQHEPSDTRATRLSLLVSAPEAARITKEAAAAGLSVSAFLRGRALGSAPERGEDEALRQVDALIDRMTSDLDGALARLDETLAKLSP